MLTEHAILFHTRRFTLAYYAIQMEAAATGKYGDCLGARLQSKFNVYALSSPLFYQAKELGGKESETLLNWTNDESTCNESDIVRQRVRPFNLTDLIL